MVPHRAPGRTRVTTFIGTFPKPECFDRAHKLATDNDRIVEVWPKLGPGDVLRDHPRVIRVSATGRVIGVEGWIPEKEPRITKVSRVRDRGLCK